MPTRGNLLGLWWVILKSAIAVQRTPRKRPTQIKLIFGYAFLIAALRDWKIIRPEFNPQYLQNYCHKNSLKLWTFQIILVFCSVFYKLELICSDRFQQIVLDGEPWGQNSSFGLHGRSAMILVLRAANSRGWNMIASADVSAKTHKDVKQLFNRQQKIIS